MSKEFVRLRRMQLAPLMRGHHVMAATEEVRWLRDGMRERLLAWLYHRLKKALSATVVAQTNVSTNLKLSLSSILFAGSGLRPGIGLHTHFGNGGKGD